MFCDFDLVKKGNTHDSIVTAHIAEGPGGFLEALVNYRKNSNDMIYGMTLKSTDNTIPDWTIPHKLFKYNNICLTYGKDKTGSLYNLDNIIYLKKYIDQKVDLVTADGGFDYSVDFNSQEVISQKLIFSEIITALTIQKNGGNFVCKIFDIFNYVTLELLWLISCFYEKIIITKPFTSRPANSEKYIVAKNFKGISDGYLKKLYQIQKLWHSQENKGFYISRIFSDEVPQYFKLSVQQYNIYNTKIQIENILKTVFIIINELDKDKYYLKQFRKIQIDKALIWCKKYQQAINTRCDLLRSSNRSWRNKSY